MSFKSIISISPSNHINEINFCFVNKSFMWRSYNVFFALFCLNINHKCWLNRMYKNDNHSIFLVKMIAYLHTKKPSIALSIDKSITYEAFIQRSIEYSSAATHLKTEINQNRQLKAFHFVYFTSFYPCLNQCWNNNGAILALVAIFRMRTSYPQHCWKFAHDILANRPYLR